MRYNGVRLAGFVAIIKCVVILGCRGLSLRISRLILD